MSRPSAHADLFDGFSTPRPEYSPVPIWWWSGERLELDRLCWQLDQLVSQGVYNVVVLNLAPTGPTYGSLADDPPLLSEEWWAIWEGLCAHARGIGARLWFYDQIGFSGANLQGLLVTERPEFMGASLERVSVDSSEAVELECPAAGEPLAAFALPLDASGEVSGPPVALELADRRARWEGGSGPHRVMLAYSLRQGFDYTSREACAKLIDTVHGEFDRRLSKFIGEVIVGSFQDELPSLPTWSPSFADEFATRRGYRLETQLAALWEDFGTESARVRADYQRVRAGLAEDALFRPLFDWHDSRGLLLGVDQQGPSRAGEPISCTKQYADYARTHRWYSAPGSDHHGEARIHSSLAHHYDRPRTWIESFHSSGWGGTLEETFDWLVPWLLSGANLYNPHAVYYSTRGGWYEWAPPSTCWRQPYWRHYRHFADTVSRLSWLLTEGEHTCDVGVLFPSATIQAASLLGGPRPEADRAHRAYLDLVGRMVWFDPAPGVFDRAGHDFDVLDDDTVAGARVDGAGLHTRAETYRAVVLPSCTVLEADTASRLVEFCEQGGLLVVVGDLPSLADSSAGDAAVARLRELVAAGTAVHVETPEDVPAVLERLGRAIRTDGRLLRRVVDDRQVLLVPAAPSGTITRMGGTQDWIGGLRGNGYGFDPTDWLPSTTVTIDGSATEVEQWDPLTGTSRPADVRQVDGGVEVTVDFATAPAAVLVWRSIAADSAASDAAAPSERNASSGPVDRTEFSLEGSWSSILLPTTDNSHGDLALPAHEGPLPVQQWRLDHRLDSAADWGSVLVGQGTFGWLRRSGSDWEPIKYSLSRGIENDQAHARMLGPKARVPDEFWHVDKVEPGEVVELRTTLPVAEAGEYTLAIGTNGSAEVTFNGTALPADPGGFLRLDTVAALAGDNELELRVTAEKAGFLRGYWALTTDAAAFVRPEWLVPGDGGARGTAVVAKASLTVASAPSRATLQLGTDGPATLWVNGQEIATQGAFEPYGGQNRVLPYDVTTVLRPGDNEVEVRFTDIGGPLAVLVDAELEFDDGRLQAFVTDDAWTFQRDGVSVPTARRRAQTYDPRWALLRPRPHPLPRAGWFEPIAHAETVLDLVPNAFAGGERTAEWFRLTVPPGATSCTLPVASDRVSLWMDDSELSADRGMLSLPGSEREHRVLTIRVEPVDGRTEGALWDGPPIFACGEGRMSEGEWADAGLGSYSGGVTYRRQVEIDSADVTDAATILELGRVRGTAEVRVNGELIGARVWSPYRFDISAAVRPGANEIEVSVFNTLAPYLDDASPTTMVFGGQRVSGLLGPVKVVREVPA